MGVLFDGSNEDSLALEVSFCGFGTPLRLQHSEGDAVDLTQLEEEEALDASSKARKKLGIPEMDPDSLPSACISKYMNLISNQVVKQQSQEHFDSQCAT